jgi:predicted homoserine dehydrogenase-like protein
MFLAQAPTTPGLEVAAVADLAPERARAACAEAGWDETRIAATTILDSGADLARLDGLDAVIEATGHPAAGASHALAAIEAGRHVVMVTVEADVLCGPALAARARAAGVVYSLAYGDQPALIAELVDWARAAGFRVRAAGKGTKYLPAYHAVTPDEVWEHYGLGADEAAEAGMNPRMFTSFLDGTKSAIEMAAVANACGLDAPADGLGFPPCGADELASVLAPAEGASGRGVVEVVSSLARDGTPVARDLRWGVFVVIEAPTPYAAACFRQYGMPTDPSGRFAALWRPFHLIGMELGISVASAVLRGEPTGCPEAFRADAVAVAKRDLAPGETLDGEGGFTVWGRCWPAARSVRLGALPIGLAHGLATTRAIAGGNVITAADVTAPPESDALRLRAETAALLVPA